MMKKWLKRGIAGTMVTTLLFTTLGLPSSRAAESSEKYNYASALQMSMYFYDANMCGSGISDGLLEWRGDCHLEDQKIPLVPKNKEGYGTNMSQAFIDANKKTLDPDGDGTVNLDGGYHDAGDHVKFGLPQSYSGSTVGWGYYEFRDSYINIGEQEHIETILRQFNDYFLRSTFRDANGDVVAFAYQVGDGTSDHNYWGPPELQTTPRPVWFATEENPASDQCAGAAASLAVNYLNFKETDPDYAEKCLDTAVALYEFAKQYRGTGFSGGFYNSSFDEDEMSWAAVWLNIATGEEQYINDITSKDETGHYTGYLKKIINSTEDDWQNIWVHSWDTVWGGVFAKLAPITNNPDHWYFFRWNIEYWAGIPHEDPNDGTFMASTPAGYKVINTWGSNRYNAAAQMCALVYNKYKPNQEFVDWVKSQMDYILGDNPMDRCYMVGYAENSAKNPHHRAAHGSLTNSMLDPVEEEHTLWGALVGGPDATDTHVDDRTDYVYNEVAIDYNAGFVGALAGIYEIYGAGQEPLKNFPAKEERTSPYYASAKLEQENGERTQVTVKIHNNTCVPPQREDTMKARYYFNISEMQAAGQSIDDVKVEVMYDQASVVDGKATKINGPYAADEENGIYYIELDWSGNSFHGNREIHFGLVPGLDSSWKANWDPTNDWSRQGITKEEAVNNYIPVYVEDKLVNGEEPDTTGTVTTPTTKPVETTAPTKKPSETTTPVETVAPTEKPVVTTTPTQKPNTSSVAVSVVSSDKTPATSGMINTKLELKNTGKEAIDFSKMKIRYYYTNETNKTQEFNCDYASMILSKAPWNLVLSDNVKATFGKVSPAKEGADSYCEISFAGVNSTFDVNQKLSIQGRIVNSDWSNMNQEDDYSYQGDNNILVYYGDEVIFGVEPK